MSIYLRLQEEAGEETRLHIEDFLRGEQPVPQFWNWSACRKFIEEAIEHYKQAPGWFTEWLDDLYIRLEQDCGSIPLDEIQTLAMLYSDGSWEPENYAVNRVYKLFDRLKRDTTGVVGY